MKIFSKGLATVLTVAMLVCMMMTSWSLSAADLSGNEDLVFNFESVAGKRGTSIEVPIYITKNTGSWGYQLDIGFDSDILTFSKFEIDSNAEEVMSIMCVKKLQSDIVALQSNGISDGKNYVNNTYTGPVGKLFFNVATSISDCETTLDVNWLPNNMIKIDGDGHKDIPAYANSPVMSFHEYTVSYEWSSNGKSCIGKAVCDYCEDTITETATITNSVITQPTETTKGTTRYTASFQNSLFSQQTKDVEDVPTTGTAFIVSVGNASGTLTDTVTVPVTITKNNGVWGFDFDILFDPAVLEYVGYEDGTAASGLNPLAEKKGDNVVVIQAMGNNLQTYENQGVFVNLTFKILGTATVGTTDLEVSYNPKNVIDHTGNILNSEISNGYVVVEDLEYIITYEWSADGKTCTAKAVSEGYEDFNITETVNSTSKIKQPASCTAKGITTYSASFTNPKFSTQTKDIQDIDFAEHEYVISYTWAEDGSSCSAVAECKVCKDKVEENASISSKVTRSATTEAKGETTYTATFNNAIFATQTKAIEDIDPHTHDYVITYEWSNDGKSCVAKASCKECIEVVTSNGVITSEVTREATADLNGETTYTATFDNPLFETQTKKIDDIVFHTHEYDITYEWSADGKTCTAKAECKGCTDTITSKGTVTSEVTRQPTTDAKGVTTYTATFDNPLFESQVKEIEDIEVISHDYVVTYEWTEDGKSCVAKAVCGDCGDTITENGAITSEIAIEATMLKEGSTKYTATFTNSLFTTQEKTVQDIPRKYLLGDVNSDGVVDMKDILMLRKELAHMEIDRTVYNPKAADANEDTQVDMKDVLVIRKYIANIIPTLGKGAK